MKRAVKSSAEYERRMNLTDWKQVIDDKKEGLVIWQRESDEGRNAMKASAIIDYSPDEIMKILGDANPQWRKDYDPMFDEAKIMKKIGDQTFLSWQKTKKIAVVSARDVLFILHFTKVFTQGLNGLGGKWKYLRDCAIN